MRRAVAGFLACLAIYLALAVPQLELPGLHNDEAAEAGRQAAQILTGQPIAAFRDSGVTAGERVWPLMVQDYIGALHVYLSLPFLALGGFTATALRASSLAVGALTLAGTFGFMRTVWGLRAALVAGLLLAVSPSFIFWQRQGVYVTSITATLAVTLLWLGAVYARRGGWGWALALGLAAGLGIYAKLLFIWVVNGLLGALVVANLPGLPRWLTRLRQGTTRSPGLRLWPRTPTMPEWLAAGAGLLAGLAPLLAYNLQTGGTWLSIGANLGTSYYGVNNADVLANLGVRLIHFRAVLEGRDHLWYLGGSFSNPAWPAVLLLAVAILAVGTWRRWAGARVGLLLAGVLALGVLQSAFTVSGLFPTHFAIFAPLWVMVVAAGAEVVATRSEARGIPAGRASPGQGRGEIVIGTAARAAARGGARWQKFAGPLAALLALAWLGARDVGVVLRYHSALAASGGIGPHTDAVYRLRDYLTEQAGTPSVALDWGFAPQIAMLTRGQVVPQEIFGYDWEPDPGFAERVMAALPADGPALVIFHVPQETVIPRREAFDALAQAEGWRVEVAAVIARRDGAPVFEVLRVTPK